MTQPWNLTVYPTATDEESAAMLRMAIDYTATEDHAAELRRTLALVLLPDTVARLADGMATPAERRRGREAALLVAVRRKGGRCT